MENPKAKTKDTAVGKQFKVQASSKVEKLKELRQVRAVLPDPTPVAPKQAVNTLLSAATSQILNNSIPLVTPASTQATTQRPSLPDLDDAVLELDDADLFAALARR